MVQRNITHSKVISSTEGSLSSIALKKWERVEQIDALVRPELPSIISSPSGECHAARFS